MKPARCLTIVLLVLALPVLAQDKESASEPRKRNVAIVVHEGIDLLDFAGPGQVFQVALSDRGRAFQVYTVAVKAEPILSQGFVKVTPNYSIKDCPKPDIIVIPGGQTRGVMHNEPLMAWLKAVAPETEIMFSVSTGAFVLGKLGLLDDKEATTHYNSVGGLQEMFPKCRVQRDRRVVDNGSVVTTAGIAAGIDGALHIVARLYGPERAVQTARYIEYRWEPEAGNGK
jgi:transcriptional regulator GlxA family with amidase domain